MVKIKIGIFLPTMAGGGAERVMLLLAEEFAALGYEVDLILANANGPYLRQVTSNIRVVDCNVQKSFMAIPALVRYLRNESPIAILSTLFQANIALLAAVKLSRMKVRCVVREANPLSFDLKATKKLSNILVPYLIKKCYPWADSVVSLSRGVANDLSSTTGLPKELIKVIYNPVDIAAIKSYAKEPLSHPWLSDKCEFTIVSIGRFCHQKDFQTLLRAVAIINQSKPVKLVILGDGELRPQLESLINVLGISDTVELPGFVENPFKYLARADLFVLSSLWEGLANVLLEALVCGVAIISTDCPFGPREVLKNGKYGRLVPVGDPSRLALAILDYFDGDKLVFDVDEALSCFNISRIARSYVDLMVH